MSLSFKRWMVVIYLELWFSGTVNFLLSKDMYGRDKAHTHMQSPTKAIQKLNNTKQNKTRLYYYGLMQN
jgi:hypothetical protein